MGRPAWADGAGRMGLAWPGTTRLLSQAWRADPQRLLGRPDVFMLFFYFLSHFILVISDRNY